MPLDLQASHLGIVQEILQRYVPHWEVWAFGSRVRGMARPSSDLDLCILSEGPLAFHLLSQLRDSFSSSTLPFRVDVVDWATTSASFRKIIEGEKVVVQEEPIKHGDDRGLSTNRVFLKNLLIETKDGEWGKETPFEDSVEMVVIRGTDFKMVKSGLLTGVPIRHIAGKVATRKKLQSFDILIETAGGSKGNPTGKTVFLRQGLFEKSQLPITCASFARFMRVNLTLAEPEFVYWYLQNLYLNGDMENHQVQHTGVARFQFTKFANSTEIDLPSIGVQKSITSFLGAIDDRIALLRETNTTLEAIAQALFKSWFVDFDPVHAKQQGLAPEGMDEATAEIFPDSFEESELGPIPKGWRYSSVGQLFVLTMGQSPPGDTYNNSGNGLPFYQGRTDFGFRFPTKRMFCTSPTRLAESGDTLISVRAPVGDVNMAIERCCLGRGVAGVRHPMGYRSFALYSIQGLRTKFEIHNSEGTVFGSINKKDFESLPIIEPSRNVLSVFDNVASPLDHLIVENEEQMRTLTTLRDTLLPRLISGQLRLPEAEAMPEEALSS